jgi:hypothetical protein
LQVNGHYFPFSHLPLLFFGLLGGGLEEPQGNPLGIGKGSRAVERGLERGAMLRSVNNGHESLGQVEFLKKL